MSHINLNMIHQMTAFQREFYMACDMLIFDFDTSVATILELIYNSEFTMYDVDYFFFRLPSSAKDENKKILLDITRKIVSLPFFDISLAIHTINQGECLAIRMLIGYHYLFSYYTDFIDIIFSHQSINKINFNALASIYKCKLNALDIILSFHYSSTEAVYDKIIIRIAKVFLEQNNGNNISEQLLETVLEKRNFLPENIKNDLRISHHQIKCNYIVTLEVLVSDGYLDVKPESGNIGKFFNICKHLPYEIQCMIGHAANKLPCKSFIPSSTLTKIAKHILDK